jgi:hypothetical protein
MTQNATETGEDLTDLKLRFGGRLVEQLGAQMYPSATATVAELISNAWDADARNVWVEMPFGDWEHGELVVTDDGLGMTHDAARDAYLVVGRNRRTQGGQRSPGGRLLHGRKGIGKLAAFGTATILELKTKTAGGSLVAFRLDYDQIRRQDPDIPYQVEASADAAPVANPQTDEPLDHGTRIRLTGLRLKRRLDQERFMQSMARRFALNDAEMSTFVNNEPLRRFDLDLDVRFPPDVTPPGTVVEDNWAIERLSNGKEVRWWMGFTRMPLKGEAEQGISVLVRGKLAQRPFKFERNTGGTTGQLGQEYLVGEVVADWIDDEAVDDGEDQDLIQSNRDQLRLEDSNLDPFVAWGQQRLRWALSVRAELRSGRAAEHLHQIEPLERMLDDFPVRERSGLFRVAEAVSRLPEVDDSQLVKVMKAVVGTREGETARALAHEIAVTGFAPERFWPLLYQLSEIDVRTAHAFLDARLETIAQLRELDDDAALRENVARVLRINPGLLDPDWELCEAEPLDVGSVEEGIGCFVVSHSLRAEIVGIVLTGEENLSATSLDAVLVGLRETGSDPVPLVVATTTNKSDLSRVSPMVTTWSALLTASESAHLAWRDLLQRRAERARQEMP